MLPAANEVQLSFFNGMSDNCGMPIFKMTYPDPITGKEVAFNIDFKNFNKYTDDPGRERNYVISQMFPNTEFTIHPTSVKCNDSVFSFADYKFGKYPVSCYDLLLTYFASRKCLRVLHLEYTNFI